MNSRTAFLIYAGGFACTLLASLAWAFALHVMDAREWKGGGCEGERPAFSDRLCVSASVGLAAFSWAGFLVLVCAIAAANTDYVEGDHFFMD